MTCQPSRETLLFILFVMHLLKMPWLFSFYMDCLHVSQITVASNNLALLKSALQGNVTFDISQGDSNLTSGFVKANQTFENTPVLRV